ncbi:UDP-N-acetylmuramoyl-tripeptide--D-alanyl-D-alanine ligase [Crinalium epipsammum PCC 9333]|uniref:UDP-N-acetylmuramoyl-tripeptide--D-alanyl-D-alanine ligase n=1 Tax=Crinalium epipsammum PCC 9333 TaxID=1173022 RepID=K9VVI4_9CYAN|nr:UDP-N-acetylmuramoyl-tripeptide--D-alanyl-D-alanine ligase [Crinalium epipsammum]AFZ12108.1 UDP-N-acetylmuramoyl-tripeptide--D-alanyl-D-alanine ligase [Crinalium epipsammum PCC 9333]
MLGKITLAQLREIVSAAGSQLSDEDLVKEIVGINTDTRSLKAGEVFVALQGENFDGHNFVDLAIEKGAIAVITHRRITDGKITENIPQLVVENTLKAYQAIAHWWRNQFSIPVIAVTGSVGKTTTKELIAAILSTKGKVLKTQANYNNEIGVPKTLLELSSEHNYAVIEMAMRGPGEIAELAQIANPTLGVITNVGTAHIGRLGSEEAIAKAKCELLAEMSESAIAVLNQDNQLLIETAKIWQGKTLTYGLEGGDIHGELIDSKTIQVEGMHLPLPLPGRHNALNYLAALAIAKILQIDWTPFTQGLEVNLPSGRAKRYDLSDDVVILDETYNAGLESMLAALHLLAETPGKRHIAVLGTMKELGEKSPQFHVKVGETARQLNLDTLLVLVNDPEAEGIAQGAEGIPTERFSTHADIVERLQEIVQAGDRILFKASHSVGLDQVVNQFR